MARIVRLHEYGDASVLKIENLDVPPPGADEVQIEVKSIGLNRAEVMFRTHIYLQEAQFPSRLGFEVAGIVKTVGASVTGFKKGDVVSLIGRALISALVSARHNIFGMTSSKLGLHTLKEDGAEGTGASASEAGAWGWRENPRPNKGQPSVMPLVQENRDPVVVKVR